MPRQYFNAQLSPLQVISATQVTGTSADQDLLGASVNCVIPTPTDIGAMYRCRAGGIMTTAASTPGTLTMTLRWGSTSAGTLLATSAAGTLLASQTNAPWEFDGSYCIRTTGATGSIVASGVLTVPTAVIAVTSVVAGSNGAITISTVTAGGFFVGVQLGAATDTMQSQYVILESVT